jgi:hypothetical protein
MKISQLIQRPSGSWRAGRVVDHTWMNRAEFERHHPGRPLPVEQVPLQIDGLPDGFRFWMTDDGKVLAVQEN